MTEPRDEKPDDRNPILRDFALFGLIVSELLGYTGAGIVIGWWLSRELGVSSWAMAALAVLGLSAAMFRIYKRSSKG